MTLAEVNYQCYLEGREGKIHLQFFKYAETIIIVAVTLYHHQTCPIPRTKTEIQH